MGTQIFYKKFANIFILRILGHKIKLENTLKLPCKYF